MEILLEVIQAEFQTGIGHRADPVRVMDRSGDQLLFGISAERFPDWQGNHVGHFSDEPGDPDMV